MVVGVGSVLPAIPLDGLATDATTRSGRKSRIVSVAVLVPTSAAFSGGSTSCSPTTRLPSRISALLVTIGTLNVLTISPGPNVERGGDVLEVGAGDRLQRRDRPPPAPSSP